MEALLKSEIHVEKELRDCIEETLEKIIE